MLRYLETSTLPLLRFFRISWTLVLLLCILSLSSDEVRGASTPSSPPLSFTSSSSPFSFSSSSAPATLPLWSQRGGNAYRSFQLPSSSSSMPERRTPLWGYPYRRSSWYNPSGARDIVINEHGVMYFVTGNTLITAVSLAATQVKWVIDVSSLMVEDGALTLSPRLFLSVSPIGEGEGEGESERVLYSVVEGDSSWVVFGLSTVYRSVVWQRVYTRVRKPHKDETLEAKILGVHPGDGGLMVWDNFVRPGGTLTLWDTVEDKYLWSVDWDGSDVQLMVSTAPNNPLIVMSRVDATGVVITRINAYSGGKEWHITQECEGTATLVMCTAKTIYVNCSNSDEGPIITFSIDDGSKLSNDLAVTILALSTEDGDLLGVLSTEGTINPEYYLAKFGDVPSELPIRWRFTLDNNNNTNNNSNTHTTTTTTRTQGLLYSQVSVDGGDMVYLYVPEDGVYGLTLQAGELMWNHSLLHFERPIDPDSDKATIAIARIGTQSAVVVPVETEHDTGWYMVLGACNGNGISHRYNNTHNNNTTSRCECYPGYYGDDCKVHCISSVTCNNNGLCNPRSGLCECSDAYVGPACTVCPCSDSAGGLCNRTTGLCDCRERHSFWDFTRFSGRDCHKGVAWEPILAVTTLCLIVVLLGLGALTVLYWVCLEKRRQKRTRRGGTSRTVTMTGLNVDTDVSLTLPVQSL